ncbi:MAG: ABC transporter ATP-binding protein [Parvibaculaceae bacterium]
MSHDKQDMLDLQKVVKRFGGLTALDNVSLHVRRGEIVGIIGPNGSGKTTLFANIAGFQTPDSGSITFEGQSIVGRPPFRICEMGLVRTFQITQPFGDLTVADNVLVGAMRAIPRLAEAREKSAEVLEFVGLAPQARKQANGLTIADRKRLELARAIATQPKLLLLDEIMAGLRPAEVDTAIELIARIRRSGVTVVLVEHLMRAVMALSERLYVLHHGGLIAEGEPSEVIQRPEVVDAYFGEHVAPA